MLIVKDLEVCYGRIQAVKKVSFDLNQGELLALIGANGAGKSTILKAVSGLLPKKGGQVMFQNECITEFPAHKISQRGLIQIPEGRRVFPHMSVDENLNLGAYSQKKPDDEIKNRILEEFPILKKRIKQMASTLSGGEQQMLAMGRALMSCPKVLMMDEPSMGLAPLLVQQIFSMIQRLKQQGVTILLVEQNAEMALEIADRAYVLETGNIVASGTGKELRQSNTIRKAYLGLS
jgi:branched-chain amino acid transport system ATP-binding protein